MEKFKVTKEEVIQNQFIEKELANVLVTIMTALKKDEISFFKYEKRYLIELQDYEIYFSEYFVKINNKKENSTKIIDILHEEFSL